MQTNDRIQLPLQQGHEGTGGALDAIASRLALPIALFQVGSQLNGIQVPTTYLGRAEHLMQSPAGMLTETVGAPRKVHGETVGAPRKVHEMWALAGGL